jgi:hypothetical protein
VRCGRREHHVAGTDQFDLALIWILPWGRPESANQRKTDAVGVVRVGRGSNNVSVQNNDLPLAQLACPYCRTERKAVRLVMLCSHVRNATAPASVAPFSGMRAGEQQTLKIPG